MDMRSLPQSNPILMEMDAARIMGMFRFTCQRIVRVLVDEYHMPNSKKRIKPTRMGTSQEEVFINNGVLFRFAVSDQGKRPSACRICPCDAI